MSKKTTSNKGMDNIDILIEQRRKEYSENENYRLAMEKEFIEHPTHMKYLKGLYRYGKGHSVNNDVLLFPIKVINARLVFGKLQCQVTPLSNNDNGLLSHPLGMKWVDRKFLIFEHDHEFIQFKSYIYLENE